jgi:Coenzyme PQQ synthesis protein D (PqqD)
MQTNDAARAPVGSMPPAERCFCRTKNHRYRRFGDEGVVVLIERGEVVAVNAVGAHLLELWNEECTLEHATRLITAEYSVEAAVAFSDAVEFATEMVALGVLEERSSS